MGSQGSLPVKGSHSTLRKNVHVVTVKRPVSKATHQGAKECLEISVVCTSWTISTVPVVCMMHIYLPSIKYELYTPHSLPGG